MIERIKQNLQRPRLGQLLAEQPDRIGIGRRRAKVKAKEAQPAGRLEELIDLCVMVSRG
jgi:hypothetical protein